VYYPRLSLGLRRPRMSFGSGKPNMSFGSRRPKVSDVHGYRKPAGTLGYRKPIRSSLLWRILNALFYYPIFRSRGVCSRAADTLLLARSNAPIYTVLAQCRCAFCVSTRDRHVCRSLAIDHYWSALCRSTTAGWHRAKPCYD